MLQKYKNVWLKILTSNLTVYQYMEEKNPHPEFPATDSELFPSVREMKAGVTFESWGKHNILPTV